MANGINKVILIGNLGKDPDILRMESGVKKASFSLATTEVYKNKEGVKTEHTEWHNIVLWRNLAEVAENYLKKGSQVYIEGRIRRRDYEDKEGVKKFVFEINGDVLQMLGGGPRHDATGASEQHSGNVKPENGNGNVDAPLPEDDLPF
jgi:single-strand DNA-binding protein